MTELPQNSGSHSSASGFCATCPKIYAAICYVRHESHPSYSQEDFAFKKAGQTFLRKMKENSYAGYDMELEYSSSDRTVIYTFYDESSFRSAWQRLLNLSTSYKVYGVAIFAHHGVDDHGKSALYGGSPATGDSLKIHGSEVAELPKLNWISGKSFIFLAACNLDQGSDNVAARFHSSQGVRVYSSRAYAYFSEGYRFYDRKEEDDDDIYLLAFVRGVNLVDRESWLDYRNPLPGMRIWEQIRN